ncbi:MAG: DUF3899 domain-containing protein [Eubacteriales bacterium]|nr:DUF3899 domain-containing protein [Eubacteriales bacterium]
MQYVRLGLSGAVLTAAVFVLRGKMNLVGASDAFAVSGICFLIAALFLTAKHLHAYDLLIYGFQKFKNLWRNKGYSSRESLDYHEFLAQRHYPKTETAYFAAAGVLLLLALLLALAV